MTGLEMYSYTEGGYKTQTVFGAWRVAYYNGRPNDSLDTPIRCFDRHMETDEIFVLLQGSCQLVVAGEQDKPQDMQRTDMIPGNIYNVKRGFWHCHVQSPDAKILIVENADTGTENSQRHYL